MRNRSVTVGRLLAALLVVGSLLVPGAPAAAAAAAPTLTPSNGHRDLPDNDPAVDFGGTVDEGWAYRADGADHGQAWVEFRDASGREVARDDVTTVLQVSSSGQISGGTTLNTSFGARADAKTVRLAVRVTRDGEVEVGHSADLRIDRERPQIAGYSVIDPSVIQVTFSEEVRSPSGDDRRDWRVEDATVSGVRQPANGDLRLRYLDLLRPLDPDATPRVQYAVAIGNSRYIDMAGRPLGADNVNAVADDEIPPELPDILSVDGVTPSGDVIVRGATQPEVRVGSVTPGHTIELYRDALVDTTRDLDPDGPDVLLASKTVPDGADEVTFAASDYHEPLAADADGDGERDEDDVHTLYVRAVDANGNDAVSSVRYRVDDAGPVAEYAVADGRFVTVRFSEAIFGTNRAADWRVTTGGDVLSVSGSGDVRVVRTEGDAAGRIRWTPPTGPDVTPYRDAHGNRLQGVDLPIERAGDLTITDDSATEGSNLSFQVRVARPSGDETTYAVDYATEDGTATAGEDYTATSGQLSFGPGVDTHTVPVPTRADDLDEGAETMTLRLSSPRDGARLPSDPTATGTILDPAGAAALSVFDARGHEGTTARAVVQLSSKAARDVTVEWRTADRTATAGLDYTAGSGRVRIAEGTRESTIVLPLLEDDTTEPTETFVIELSDPVNATLARDTATVSIFDGPGVPPGIGRVAGETRVETATNVSKAFYSSADTVVVATANAYPDALAGAPLADRHDAPILLSTRERLHPAAAEEVRRLGADTAIVLGGGNALAAQVDRDLRAAGVTTVRRIAGDNRYDTARMIAAELGGDAVYVVEGAHANPARGWPDAVAVSALAASQRRPILLVERDRLPGETSAALHQLDPSRATIVGGPAAINGAVEAAVDARAGDVDRIAGRTRYETSRAVADASVAAGLDPGNTWFATGDDWPDSLSASPAIARTGGVLLLVDSDRLDDSPPARDWLVTHRDRLRSITLVGGTQAISSFVAEQIRSQSGLRPR